MLTPILHGCPHVIFITIFSRDDMLMMVWMGHVDGSHGGAELLAFSYILQLVFMVILV